MILFRHADPRFPFLWEEPFQPGGRWHAPGEGPVHYFADTPDGAWAELLRHEEIRDPEDLEGISRALWTVELSDEVEIRIDLPAETAGGGIATYEACREEAARLRSVGIQAFRAPSAALVPGGAGGWVVDDGLRPGPPRDGEVIVLFGRRSDLVGWKSADEGRPPRDLLEKVRHLSD